MYAYFVNYRLISKLIMLLQFMANKCKKTFNRINDYKILIFQNRLERNEKFRNEIDSVFRNI